MIGNFFSSWEPWAVLFVVLAIGISFVILQKKSGKYLKFLPKPLFFIFLGAILVGGGMYYTGFLSQENWYIVAYFGIVAGCVLFFLAGFDVDIKEIRRFGKASILMGILPSMIEGFLIGTILLPMMKWFNPSGFTWDQWAFAYVMGYALAAATPSVIILIVKKFKRQGYSRHNHLNEVISIGASLDDITALTMLVIFLSIATPQEGMTIGITIAQVPFKIIWSILIGIIFAIFITQVTKKVRANASTKTSSLIVFILVFFMGIVTYELAAYILKMSQTYPTTVGWFNFEYFLSAMVTGLWCSYTFKVSAKPVRKNVEFSQILDKRIMMFWTFFGSIMLFSNSGTPILFEVFADGKIYTFIPIIIGSLFIGRYAGIRLSLYDNKKYKWNDRLFATVSFIPKGTATAAAITLINLRLGAGAEQYSIYLSEMLLPAAILGIIVTLLPAEFLITKANKKLQFRTKVDDPSPIISFKDVFHKKRPIPEYEVEFNSNKPPPIK